MPAPTAASPALTGSINLTMPLATWLGGTGAGEVPGYGPIPAADAQLLAGRLAAAPGTRWCITLTSPDGRAIGHGCARCKPGADPGGGPSGVADWELTVTIKPLAAGACLHSRESRGYIPGPGLRHLISVRDTTCTAPGCRRPAESSDLDHTTAYQQGGRSCECNLGPLCRRHHRAKQVQGWRLTQTAPGKFAWALPHGRTYLVQPAPYPPDPVPGGNSGGHDSRGGSSSPDDRDSAHGGTGRDSPDRDFDAGSPHGSFSRA